MRTEKLSGREVSFGEGFRVRPKKQGRTSPTRLSRGEGSLSRCWSRLSRDQQRHNIFYGCHTDSGGISIFIEKLSGRDVSFVDMTAEAIVNSPDSYREIIH
jgi:hypothetical protein